MPGGYPKPTALDPTRGNATDGQTGAPVIQYWHAPEPPDDVSELVGEFRDGNPDLPHLLFDERSAEDLISEYFGSRHLAAFRSCAVPAMQADYFRYCAVHALGGIYVDADFGFARPLRPLLDVPAQLFEQPPHGPMLNNLFAFHLPEHPFLALTIEVATRNIEARVCDQVAIVTGPAIFTALLQLHRGLPLEDLRARMNPSWRPQVEARWDQIVAILDGAVADLGPLAPALADVRIATRQEMLSWVDRSVADLPYKSEADYWDNWEGSIFRSPGGGGRR